MRHLLSHFAIGLKRQSTTGALQVLVRKVDTLPKEWPNKRTRNFRLRLYTGLWSPKGLQETDWPSPAYHYAGYVHLIVRLGTLAERLTQIRKTNPIGKQRSKSQVSTTFRSVSIEIKADSIYPQQGYFSLLSIRCILHLLKLLWKDWEWYQRIAHKAKRTVRHPNAPTIGMERYKAGN